MSENPKKPDPLDADFDALKAQAEPPSAELMVRILADADALQATAHAAPVPKRPPFSVRFMDLIGGWPSVAGLATAGVAGVWIGMSQSAAFVAGSEVLFYGDVSSALVDLDPGFGFSDLDGGL